MTVNEVRGLLAMIEATYPNFKVIDASATLKAWSYLLSEYPAKDIELAFKAFVTTNGTAFAPSVAELIAMTRKPFELSQLSEGEAWALVMKAIENSGYHAHEEFEKLPVECQKAIGAPNQLRDWAIDSSFNASVVGSNFQRAYRNVLERKRDMEALPVEMRNLIETSAAKLEARNG